jgi:hypothetical protein
VTAPADPEPTEAVATARPCCPSAPEHEWWCRNHPTNIAERAVRAAKLDALLADVRASVLDQPEDICSPDEAVDALIHALQRNDMSPGEKSGVGIVSMAIDLALALRREDGP